MLVRYLLPLIFVLVALVLALAPLETAGQPVSGSADASAGKLRDKDHEQARPKTPGAPVNSGADKKAVPPGVDARKVRPAQAFPPERIAPSPDQAPPSRTPQAPSRGGVQTPDQPATGPAAKDDPRSVEEQPDPGG
jgi:hypothetical protein